MIQILEENAKSNFLSEREIVDLETSIKSALEAIWSERLEIENGSRYATWSKYGNEIPAIYPGVKYGAAGIMKAFVSAFTYFNDNKYINWIEEIADQLISESVKLWVNPSWGYSYSDLELPLNIAMTDLSFGSLGIIDAILQGYEVTMEAKYLEFATEASQWLDEIAQPRNMRGETFNVLPGWGDFNSQDKVVVLSGLKEGNAGSIQVFDRLGRLSNNSFWSEWSKDIATWLSLIQKDDGSWSHNADLQDLTSRTSRYYGTSGIIEAMINSNPQLFSSQIKLGLDWLVSQIIMNDTHFLIPDVVTSTSGRYDLDFGLAGILRSLRLSNITEFTAIINDTWMWYLTNILYQFESENDVFLGFVDSSLDGSYLDFSFSEGISGVIWELTQMLNEDRFNSLHNEIEGTIQLYIKTMLAYQEDGLWQRQIHVDNKYLPEIVRTPNSDLGNLWLLPILLISTLLLFSKILRKRI